MLPALGQRRLDEIRLAEIEDFKAEMKNKISGKGRRRKKLSHKTINNTLTVLRKLLSVAAAQRLIEHGSSPSLSRSGGP